MRTNPTTGPTRERGIALLLVLWVIMLLAVICAEFSATMRSEATIARNFRDSEQAYYAAESGINRTLIELMRTSAQRSSSMRSRDAAEADLAAAEQAELEFWRPGNSYDFEFEDMKCRVEIEDESNKIDLNSFLQNAKKNPEPLKQILRKKMGLEGEDVDIVADSLIDWRDTDNNITGASGAEEDYYKQLNPPYLCRNGPLPVIEELLLVRGIDEDLLYGRRGRVQQKIELTPEDLDDILSGRPLPEQLLPPPDIATADLDDDEAGIQYLGFVDIFSVGASDYSSGAKVSTMGDITIDINTATLGQLLVLRGMTPFTAAQIVQERRIRPFAGKEDRLPGFQNYFQWKDSIKANAQGSMNGKMLRINAKGCTADGDVCRKITCTLFFVTGNYFFTSWQEN